MKLKLFEEGLKNREVKDYVQDIYDAMEAAEEFVNNWTFEEFAEDRKTQFAVIRALEIIGEATKNIPRSTRKISFCSVERPGRDTGQINPCLLWS